MFQPIDLLIYLTTYAVFCLVAAFFVLGLFLASNHKFVEDGVEKSLILVNFKEAIDRLLKAMDTKRVLVAIKNWVVLLLGLSAVAVGTVKFLQSSNPVYLLLCLWIVTWTGYKKSFYDLGVMFLGCFRCMSTFWLCLPLMISGTVLGWNTGSAFLWLIPLGIVTTGVVSAIVSMVYMTYDRCKLAVLDEKRKREILRMETEQVKSRRQEVVLALDKPVDGALLDQIRLLVAQHQNEPNGPEIEATGV